MKMDQPATSTRRLLVVGNGPTGEDEDGRYHVDLTCGHFLLNLAAAGHQVGFMQAVEPVHRALNYYGCVLGDEVSAVGLDRRTVVAAIRTSFAALRALARAEFVHLFFPGRLPVLVAALCRAIGKPYGLYVRGDRFTLTGAEGRTLRHAAFILAASKYLATRVRPLNPGVALIRPMCELSSADVVRRDLSARPPGPLRILFVGRVEADKGIPELIEAAEILHQRGIGFELRLAGLGDLHAELAMRFAGNDRILVLGAVEDRPALMRMYEEADIFVLPSHHEGFPRVLYEAMLKSAPVVTTMVGGIPGLLKDEENCLAIPVGNARAIADAVERLAGDTALMQRLADAGVASALTAIEGVPSHAEVLQQRIAEALRGRHAPQDGHPTRLAPPDEYLQR